MNPIKVTLGLILMLTANEVKPQSFRHQSFGMGIRETYYPGTFLSGAVLHADIPISNVVSMQYSVGGGFAPHKGAYFHMPITFPFLLAAVATYPSLWGLFALIPESLSFKLNANSRSEWRLNAHFNSMLYTKIDTTESFRIPIGTGTTIFLNNKKHHPVFRIDLAAGVLTFPTVPYVNVSASWCISQAILPRR